MYDLIYDLWFVSVFVGLLLATGVKVWQKRQKVQPKNWAIYASGASSIVMFLFFCWERGQVYVSAFEYWSLIGATAALMPAMADASPRRGKYKLIARELLAATDHKYTKALVVIPILNILIYVWRICSN